MTDSAEKQHFRNLLQGPYLMDPEHILLCAFGDLRNFLPLCAVTQGIPLARYFELVGEANRLYGQRLSLLMIDNQDKQTQTLDLGPAPKRRGRPAKEKALSNAERQRLYRERQKAQRNEKQESHAVPYEEVVAIAQELGERCKKAEARVKELEKQLEQRNEKPSRLNEGMRKIIQDVHEIADATQGSTWRIRGKPELTGTG